MRTLREQYPTLLEPELLADRRFGPLVVKPEHEQLVATMHANAELTRAMAHDIEQPPLLVHIQGRELQPFHDEGPRAPYRQVESIIATARNIRAQQYSGAITVAATVDRQHYRPWPEHVKELADLDVAIYRTSQETGLADAFLDTCEDIEKRQATAYDMIASITAGCCFATNQALRTGALHTGEGAIGVYGPLVNGSPRFSTLAQRALLGVKNRSCYTDTSAASALEDPTFMHDAGVIMNGKHLHVYGLDVTRKREGAFKEMAHDMVAGELGEVVFEPAVAVHQHPGYFIHTTTPQTECA
jgi:hypothetical protein